MLTVSLAACPAGQVLPLSAGRPALPAVHLIQSGSGPCPPSALPPLRAGTRLKDESGQDLLVIAGHAWLPAQNGTMVRCLMARAEQDLAAGPAQLAPAREGWSLACVTLSDKGHQGLRVDTSGPAMAELVRSRLKLSLESAYLLPDGEAGLRALLTALALEDGYDLILTSGGTGVAPSDVTPQATARVLDCELPGYARAMTMASLQKTPMGCISRALAGVIGKSLVINLPGSPKAVRENLEAVLPALGHTLEKLNGEPSDCGSLFSRRD